MNLTNYHAKYFAYDLTRQLPSDSVGKFAASLQDAQVDLNPHQVEAALFAFQSPLSNGAILADEVGLGKTIEAGIILSQQWAERKRKLLIIAPANLRNQWNQELLDKFYLPSIILESKSFNDELKKGNFNPFNQEDSIVICSYQFAKSKSEYLANTNWNLVIIDEAHRLRNVYKPSNKTANTIKEALLPYKKVLLTATPLQNSILELYGLVSIVDDYVFGDLKSFKAQYSRLLEEESFNSLKDRIQPVCHRTLRRQVLEYINYTDRIPILEEFYPTVEEQQLYIQVSDYLQRPRLYALPNSQRQLMTLILRKLLASSSYAISGTLESLANKLRDVLSKSQSHNLFQEIDENYETADELLDEWENEDGSETDFFTDQELEEIQEELYSLSSYWELSKRIKKNSKAQHLITALDKGFKELNKLGANRKALIFTESRRTQDYLLETLEAEGYKDEVVIFNGVNSDEKSRTIYKDWLEKYKGTDKVSGSTTADIRSALVDYFKNTATIMIATEAAAEGINLQFCSLIVNYDMPWNPQRIEQRIGRCHRYGQKHDVVVINFLNKKNEADVRVYEILDQKFRLFSGVFGASDEVLGNIGSGVDFEKRIASIYQICRTPEEIQLAFDELQLELRPQISERIHEARKSLIENFDEEVREKLKANLSETTAFLSKFEDKLWNVTKFYLGENADFKNDYSFSLLKNPFPGERIHAGPYMILRTNNFGKKSETVVPDETNIYRVGHPMAKRILKACKELETSIQSVSFDYSGTDTKITPLESFLGQSGWMRVELIQIDSFELEEYIVMACFTDDGEVLDTELSARLFSLSGYVDQAIEVDGVISSSLEESLFANKQDILNLNTIRNSGFFDTEMEKLEQWAEDMKISLEKEIKDLDAEIKLKKSEAKKTMDLAAKVKLQREVKEMESKRSEKRRSLFEAQDEIDSKKESLLSNIEKRLSQRITEKELFTIRWHLN